MSCYHHILSTLTPVLPDALPQTSMAQLRAVCAMWLDEAHMAAFDSLSLNAERHKMYPESINAYLDFEHALRNRLVFLRCYKAGVDPDLYTHAVEGVYPMIEEHVQQVMGLPPMEKERTLDRIRMESIDFAVRMEAFNFAKVCAYKLKLEIALKYVERTPELGLANLNIIREKAQESMNEWNKLNLNTHNEQGVNDDSRK